MNFFNAVSYSVSPFWGLKSKLIKINDKIYEYPTTFTQSTPEINITCAECIDNFIKSTNNKNFNLVNMNCKRVYSLYKKMEKCFILINNFVSTFLYKNFC